MGWQGVVYRIELFQGSPVVDTLQAVSVDTAGNLANALSYEPVINGDGSQIAFTSLSDNLVADDTNAFADVFVRDFTNGKTVRVSESLNRFAIGTIRFPSPPTRPATPPNNNLRDGDSFSLRDASNEQTLTFRLAPAGANEVLIGATASASRDNLVRAINALQAAGSLNMLAVADSPASPNTFYPPTSRVPGQAYYPGLFLFASVNGSQENLEIAGSFAVFDSTNGVNSGQFEGGNLVETTGMRLGGTQADDDAGELDGVPGGSTMPSIDRTGMVVAFRSTMQTLDVFSRTDNGLNGLRPGDLMRMLRNASGNVYVRLRDVDGNGGKVPDAMDNVETKRVSVNRFGYATSALADTPSSANNHKPAVSALGRFIAFSSDAENNGGLAFGRTNLDPEDNNGYRDVYLFDRDVTAEPPVIVVNNPPDVTLTEPSWLSGRSLSVGSTITLNALVTDTDEELDIENVTFFVNGTQFPARTRYGNYFSTTVKINTASASNVIQARARDNSGASNNASTSAPITFSSVNSIAQPTNITILPLPRGTILEVGQPVELSARVTLPLGSNLWNVAFVRFYANGVLVGSDGPFGAGENNAVATFSWFPSDSGTSRVTGSCQHRRLLLCDRKSSDFCHSLLKRTPERHCARGQRVRSDRNTGGSCCLSLPDRPFPPSHGCREHLLGRRAFHWCPDTCRHGAPARGRDRIQRPAKHPVRLLLPPQHRAQFHHLPAEPQCHGDYDNASPRGWTTARRQWHDQLPLWRHRRRCLGRPIHHQLGGFCHGQPRRTNHGQ